MTQIESIKETKRKIRMAKCGKEVTDAIISHFKEYHKAPSSIERAYVDFDVPLFN